MVKIGIQQEGGDQVNNEEHSRHPSVVSDELVRVVEEKIKENCKFTINALTLEFLQISRTVINQFVTGKLAFRKYIKLLQ